MARETKGRPIHTVAPPYAHGKTVVVRPGEEIADDKPKRIAHATAEIIKKEMRSTVEAPTGDTEKKQIVQNPTPTV